MAESKDAAVLLVSMLRRAPGLHPRTFQDAWLGVGVGTLASLPGLVRYGQNHALLRGYDKGDLLFDGFEEFVFTDFDHLLAATSTAEWIGRQQSVAAITDRSAGVTATVTISLQKVGTPPAGAIRSTEYVNRRSDLSLATFRDYWIQRHGPLATNIPQIIRYEQHHLDDREYRQSEPRFDGWAATWFTGTVAMREAANEPVYQQTRADEANFLAGPLPVLFTRERLTLLGA